MKKAARQPRRPAEKTPKSRVKQGPIPRLLMIVNRRGVLALQEAHTMANIDEPEGQSWIADWITGSYDFYVAFEPDAEDDVEVEVTIEEEEW